MAAPPRPRLDDGPAVARHGVAEPRGQAPPAEFPGARFGRMFPFLPRADPGQDALAQLVAALLALAGRSSDSTRIVAGYTYLGQFIDHDVTFDATSRFNRDNDPDELADFRTPRLDLDSLYGSGPEDQPFLYDWDSEPKGVRLLVGGDRHDPDVANVDLPRNRGGRALTGDPRNDENLIVSQLHLLFLQFHNRVVDVLADEGFASDKALFDDVQREVRWHYQWIVLHDFLPKLLGRDPVLGARRFFTFEAQPYMPVEFSAAAYRFGHSMVREDYRLNRDPNVPIFASNQRDLRGFRPLPTDLQIEWQHFFPLTGVFAQKSKRIDTSLAEALDAVPPHDVPLAWLNLLRGRALGLPAGLDVARTMGVPAVAEDDLLTPLGDAVDAPARKALTHDTPLWYYVLREAELLGAGGLHLGPVGAGIVEEVLGGLLETDPGSYLRQWPGWAPAFANDRGEFRMAELIRFTRDDL